MKYSEFLAKHERQRSDCKVRELQEQLRLTTANFAEARKDRVQDSMHPDGPSIDWEEVFKYYQSNIARIKREIQEVD